MVNLYPWERWLRMRMVTMSVWLVKGGVLYASGLNDDGLLLVSWRSDLTGQCRIRYHFAKEKATDKNHGMRQLSLPCTPMK
ncbi:FimD/PapC C-terminal domain-containing protein [Serratia fonticola]|uniref:FimD/PapC C-terminal domain-containing protein n=1 Tax=Serratia fonticola TaxID=47917 RepID=UPI003F867BCD